MTTVMFCRSQGLMLGLFMKRYYSNSLLNIAANKKDKNLQPDM